MEKRRKQFKLHSIKLEATVSDRLEAHCQKTGQTKTAVIEQSVMNYIDKYEAMVAHFEKVEDVD